jgi:hypothetical protein
MNSLQPHRSSVFRAIGFLILLFASNAVLALTTLTVTSSSDNNPGGIGEVGDLRYSLNVMNQGLNTLPDDYAIVFAFPMTIQLNGILPVINNSSNPVNVTIGNPGSTPTVTIDGNGTYSGFFVATGNVTIQNMKLQNMVAHGGNGGDGISGGGGGLGAGGAIYAPQFFLNGANPSVTLIDVSIDSTSAVGGNGGNYFSLVATGNEGGGGGGGFGGNGGSVTAIGSTGGAGGGGFGGDGGNVTLSLDDVLGGGGGGGGGLGSRATLGVLTNLGNGGADQDAGSDGNGYGLVITAGAGGGGYGGGNDAGGGGGGGPFGGATFAGGGGGGSAGLNGLQPQATIPPMVKDAERSGGDGGDGGGGGGASVVMLGISNEIDGQAANGGYGGGGGGGAGTGAFDIDYTVRGGTGGVGGGGGGGGVNQSGVTPADGGNSAGGGGGAGGGPSNGSTAAGGVDLGSLGGGSGGFGATSYGSGFGGGGGGGGSGLGGAIFVDSNLNFTVRALSGVPTTFDTSNTTTQAGLHGTGGPGGTDGLDGSAVGNSIFLRSGSALTFMAHDAGDLLTLGSHVAFTDDTAFGAGGTSVFVTGDGTVVYDGTTSYQGTVHVNNATLNVNGEIDQAFVIVDQNPAFSTQKGTLGGTGTLTGDVFVNAGTVSPGAGATLTLGSLILNDPSAVHVDVDAGGASSVAVTGAASLAGALQIHLDPAANKAGSYTLLSSSAITGTFASVAFTGATPPNYSLSYLPTGAPTRVELDIVDSADMTVSSSFPPSATAGSTVTGTFTCTNNGPNPAVAATCTISGLPPGATVTCTPPVPTASPLAVGSSIACTASYTAPAGGTVSPTITAGSSTSDPDAANDTSPVTTSISAIAATPVPVNAWWNLALLMLVLSCSAAVAMRRRG